MNRIRVVGALAGGTAAAVVLAGCGGQPAPMSARQILHFDAANRTVDVTARAAYNGANGEMNFDGYANGRLTIDIPVGWLVTVHCANDSKLLLHSCAVVSDTPATLGTRPLAFPEASSPDPADGSRPNSPSTFQFVADRTGSYRIACLVHGHEIDGMWDRLDVTGALTPSASVGP
jgi:hypothetical protein